MGSICSVFRVETHCGSCVEVWEEVTAKRIWRQDRTEEASGLSPPARTAQLLALPRSPWRSCVLLDTVPVFVMVGWAVGTNAMTQGAGSKSTWSPRLSSSHGEMCLARPVLDAAWVVFWRKQHGWERGPEHPFTLENPEMHSQGYSLAGIENVSFQLHISIVFGWKSYGTSC